MSQYPRFCMRCADFLEKWNSKEVAAILKINITNSLFVIYFDSFDPNEI